MLPYFFSLIASLFKVVAVFLLFWGGVVVGKRLVVSEWNHIQGKVDRVGFEQIRVDFGQRIVLIRTVLSYFLTKEVDRHERIWVRK